MNTEFLWVHARYNSISGIRIKAGYPLWVISSLVYVKPWNNANKLESEYDEYES